MLSSTLKRQVSVLGPQLRTIGRIPAAGVGHIRASAAQKAAPEYSRAVHTWPTRKSGGLLQAQGLGLRWVSDSAENDETKDKTDDGPPSESTSEQAKPSVRGSEQVVGEASEFEFKTETRQLLDIVAHSLYHDREVFVRELTSNASDALEKARHTALTSNNGEDVGELAVTITVDPTENLFAIQDSGIGMTKEELVENLGTIAKSGSKAFINQMAEGGAGQNDIASNIIGKFGVGFYSAFMVSDKVSVFSRKRGSDKGHCWTSSPGTDSYTLSEADGVEFGTKIILQLREDAKEFSSLSRVEQIVTKYSTFVGFPVLCNGKKVNEVQALWLKSEKEISDEEHNMLYKHLSQDWEDPQYKLVYKADAPIDIKSVFYLPKLNMEKFGMGKSEPGVHLYSRRVLIQSNAKDILPEYLRFIKGIVDSEDLPLSISRESMQDQKLLVKLQTVLAKRLIRWLEDEAKKDEKQYMDFYNNFGIQIKMGVASDFANQQALAKLLRFPSSSTTDTEQTNFQAYVDRMKEGQDTIYYIIASSRQVAESSPYYEAFKRAGLEVLYCYADHDEIVLGNLGKFGDKQIKSIEVVEPPELPADAAEDKKEEDSTTEKLSDEDGKKLTEWMQSSLGTRVTEVVTTTRLVDSPAIISEHDNIITRRMMQMQEFKQLGVDKPASYKLLVNPNHPLIVALDKSRESNPETAKLVAEQILDNAIISAGILDDVRIMLPRLTDLMKAALDK